VIAVVVGGVHVLVDQAIAVIVDLVVDLDRVGVDGRVLVVAVTHLFRVAVAIVVDGRWASFFRDSKLEH